MSLWVRFWVVVACESNAGSGSVFVSVCAWESAFVGVLGDGGVGDLDFSVSAGEGRL